MTVTNVSRQAGLGRVAQPEEAFVKSRGCVTMSLGQRSSSRR